LAAWHRRDSTPETHVVWREEVEILRDSGLTDEQLADLLDDYPLKPHELLGIAPAGSSRSWRGCPKSQMSPRIAGSGSSHRPPSSPLSHWRTRRRRSDRLANQTVILPPSAGGLTATARWTRRRPRASWPTTWPIRSPATASRTVRR
jgi:CRISPR-associated endonuclease/helicase Cas3